MEDNKSRRPHIQKLIEVGRATRFPVNRVGNLKKHPDGYLTCKFKKWLNKQIYPTVDPTTGEVEQMKGLDAVAIATIKAALKGDMKATEILLERLEGKSVQKVESEVRVTKMGDVMVGDKPLVIDIQGETTNGRTDNSTRDSEDTR